MADKELFSGLAEMKAPEVKVGGRPRMREPERRQVALRAVDLDSLLAADHPARVIWAYVERLDLSVLEDAIEAREHTPGQAPPSPHLLVALWLYATSQGVGSARALARLCESCDAYRWLCGGVSLNHHGLSDFRSGNGELLDRLLSENVATLSASGVIDLDEVTQDGVRVRASAGAASFRRRKTLHKELRKAQRLVARLKGELDADPEASSRRIKAAQQRAAREREARVAAALDKLAELEAERQRRARTHAKQVKKQKPPRASTSDAQARVMKMADGGFRPAYNCQLATVSQGQIIVDLDVDTTGSDRGLLRPMLENLHQRQSHWPRRYLADGGFHNNDDTEWAAGHGVLVHVPATENKHKSDPYAPRPDDGPGVAAWRRRMRSARGKAVYKRRTMGECINARARQWGLRQFLVRGVEKVRTVLLWFALANNILAAHRLKAATP
ncbi:MAG: IS1182 family transposase [Alphaproteobacteria bacterium]|nr:IS1182 family transposase [Alphaproteobacteria bacterium]MCW5742395.1 IS1182 family transposase [Alphaproteobacteria bacterium]